MPRFRLPSSWRWQIEHTIKFCFCGCLLAFFRALQATARAGGVDGGDGADGGGGRRGKGEGRGGGGGGGGLGEIGAAEASSALSGTIEQLFAAQKRVKALEQQLRAVPQALEQQQQQQQQQLQQPCRAVPQAREGDADFASPHQTGDDAQSLTVPLTERNQRLPSVSRNKIAPPRAAPQDGEAGRKDAASVAATSATPSFSASHAGPTNCASDKAKAPSAVQLYRTILAIHEDYQHATG